MVISLFFACKTTLRREIHTKVVLQRILDDGVVIACDYTHTHLQCVLKLGKKFSSIILVVTSSYTIWNKKRALNIQFKHYGDPLVLLHYGEH